MFPAVRTSAGSILARLSERQNLPLKCRLSPSWSEDQLGYSNLRKQAPQLLSEARNFPTLAMQGCTKRCGAWSWHRSETGPGDRRIAQPVRKQLSTGLHSIAPISQKQRAPLSTEILSLQSSDRLGMQSGLRML